ncbi:chitin synthase D [Emergomyces africanus]|uniref:chitin synthase n=1 Tax=Emergomyces africanus TaxID=1955775 RepID=A0A1B7NMI0_9EURO|nr:chitin synthase D [Emergomyces africanus]
MVVTLPLPPNITRHFPIEVVSFLQWFAFWTFAILLIIPWLFCIYRLATNSVGRTKRIKEVLDERTAPKTVIVMPVYKEAPHVLIKAVDSVVDCDYPPSCIHVFLSYDGGQVDESYLTVAAHLGVPITLKSYPESIDVSYKGARITISRFKHGGKRHCQKLTFRLIDKIYAKYLQRHDNLFVLFIDSDCILDRVCLQNFMYDMELKPGSKRNMLAMTGVITSTTQKNTLITLLQDMEYIHGQLFERSVESGCGSVTCLPGALTILRFSAFRKMAKYYFADKAEQCEDLFDFGKCHLGEDRWLTHLFMIGAKERYQIQMCTSAFCKTEAVQSFRSLLKQRRRWFLGFITNEVCMLTDIQYHPYHSATIFIMVISVMTTSNKVENLPVGFIAVSLGLNYLLMLYFGAKLRRYKAWLYPLMFILNPFFNWLYMVYGIFTAGQRTWGGPRADAAAADENTTPEEAAIRAKATGDELNINVDTFRAVAEGKSSVPIHPAEGVDGRFAAPDLQPNGYYYTENDNTSTMTFPDFLPRNPAVSPLPLHPRASCDSDWTSGSNSIICLPRTVESIMGDEDQRKVQLARQSRACSSVGVEVGDVDDNPDSMWGAESMSDSGRRSISRGKDGPVRSSTRSEKVPSSSAADAFTGYDGTGDVFHPDTGVVFEPVRRRTGRSPLGRNSPVRAIDNDKADYNSPSPSPSKKGAVDVEAEDETGDRGHYQESNQDDDAALAGAAAAPTGQEQAEVEAEASGSRKKRRRSRLVKRSRDPGDMV